MTFLDYLILAILAVSLLIGLFRGFIKELISLAAWVFAVVLAIQFSPSLSHWVFFFEGRPELQTVCAFVVILVLVLLAGMLVTLLLKPIIMLSGLGFLDHVLGSVFGFVRGVLLVTLLLMFFAVTSLDRSEGYHDSILKGFFDRPVHWMKKILPEQWETLSKWVDQPMEKPNSDAYSSTIKWKHSER